MTFQQAVELAQEIHLSSTDDGNYAGGLDSLELIQQVEDDDGEPGEWIVRAKVCGPNEEMGEGSITWTSSTTAVFQDFLDSLMEYI